MSNNVMCFGSWKRILWVSLIFVFASCDKDANSVVVDDKVEIESVSNTIPINEALETLNVVLSSVGKDVVDVNNSEVVAVLNHDIVHRFRKKTKSLQAPMTKDSVLYLINLKDDGFAVLSADRRLPDDVLIITEHGTMSREEFLYSLDQNAVSLDTINIYNNEDEDYYVGAVSAFVNTMLMDYTNKYYTNTNSESVSDIAYSYSNWNTIDSVTSLITNTKWDQQTPYNNYCKIVASDKLPMAGCVPIAVAQMFASLERPTSLDDLILDWSNMKAQDYLEDGSSSAENAARMIAKIGKGCHTWYTMDFGMTTPTATAKYLQSLPDFSNVVKHTNYDENLILAMLKHGKPVVLTAFRDIFHAHGWLIDGYRYQQRYCVKYNKGRKVSETVENRLLLHCNWGWSGWANGYYVSNIFATNAGPVELDDGDITSQSTNKDAFDMLFRIITYDLQE